MLKKIIGDMRTKLFPYWCPHCPHRYRTEDQFHAHYRLCEGRRLAEKKRDQALGAIAPKNRKERRVMAKRAGAIKDWKNLNA